MDLSLPCRRRSLLRVPGACRSPQDPARVRPEGPPSSYPNGWVVHDWSGADDPCPTCPQVPSRNPLQRSLRGADGGRTATRPVASGTGSRRRRVPVPSWRESSASDRPRWGHSGSPERRVSGSRDPETGDEDDTGVVCQCPTVSGDWSHTLGREVQGSDGRSRGVREYTESEVVGSTVCRPQEPSRAVHGRFVCHDRRQ